MCFREGGGSAEYGQRPYFDHFIFPGPFPKLGRVAVNIYNKKSISQSQTQSNYFGGGGGVCVFISFLFLGAFLCLIGCILGRKGFVLDWLEGRGVVGNGGGGGEMEGVGKRTVEQ